MPFHHAITTPELIHEVLIVLKSSVHSVLLRETVDMVELVSTLSLILLSCGLSSTSPQLPFPDRDLFLGTSEFYNLARVSTSPLPTHHERS
jgi:hypothetical protein